MSETEVERYEIEEQPDAVNEPDVILVETEAEEDTQGELVKFALLAVVLLGTALVIGLLRPYIFNNIIPAVLGENQPAATIINTEAEAETLKPEAEAETEPVTDEAESEAVNSEESDESDGAAAGEEETAASEEPVNPEDFPTAVPPSQTHTVQPGENLTAIARQYGVTVQMIVDANQISNPDRVDAGTVLTIPDDQ
ncbi:MAG: LysM peptidoglycan-binding domain-containing protein [Chloroflexota bacterium]